MLTRECAQHVQGRSARYVVISLAAHQLLEYDLLTTTNVPDYQRVSLKRHSLQNMRELWLLIIDNTAAL